MKCDRMVQIVADERCRYYVADFKDNKSPIWQEIQQVRIDGEIKDDYLLHKNDLLTVRSNGSQELVRRFMYID